MDDYTTRNPITSKSSNRDSYTGTPLPANIVEGRSSAGSSSAAPSLLRRSSYEPLLHGKTQLGLGALPPPTFSRAPPGQRSVPAIEYLGGKAGSTMNGSPSTVSSASSHNIMDSSNPSSLPLGNGLMAAEPWNLWSDPSAPVCSSSPHSPSATGRNTRSPPHSATAHLDKMADSVVDDLASNIATSTLLDTDRLSKRSSKSSTSSATIPADSAMWPQELSAAPAQPFALDPSASPSAKLKANSSVDGADAQSQQPTLLPRNMSFSSLLDLPPNSNAVVNSAVGSQLNRTSSLNRSYNRPARSAGRATSTLLASSMVEPIGEIASDTNGLSASASLPALSLPESHPNGNSSNGLTSSVASSLTSTSTARNGHTSPEQQRLSGSSTAARAPSKSSFNAAYGGAFSNSGSNGLAGGLVAEVRSRQPSGSSEASIASLSLPLQPLSSFSAGSQLGSFASLNANGPTSVPMRRDADFRFAPFAASPPMQLGSNGDLHRRGSQPAWGLGGQYTGGRSLPFTAFSPSPPTSFGLSPEMSVGMTSSPSTGSSASSLYRYPSNGNDTYLGSAASLPNYGLGFHGSPAPLSSYPGYASFAAYDKPREDRMARPIRSALLETFRADKTGRWTVPDMRGHIAEFMCDQVGSRYIQEFILANPSPEDCETIFEEVCPVILQLSIDVFANFCVQRLLEKSDTEQLKQLAVAMKGSVLRLSLQTYGCRVIQKAIEIVSPEHQLMFVQELEGSVQKCVRDQNANHVIQKIVQTVPADHLQCIVNAFIGNVYTFATHPYSCRVLQRILENCGDRMTRSLLEELKGYAQALMQDQYGNYVIQYIIERGLPYDRSGVICQIFGQVLHLSKHKFASNVIEKCIMQANENELHIIAAEVLMPRHDGTTGVMSMLKHEYANYPLQRLMKHTTGPLNRAIVDQVAANLTMFRHANPPFNAKHLVAVEKLVLDSDPSGFPSLYARRYEDHYVSSKRY